MAEKIRPAFAPGITVLESSISAIDATGLRYRGYPVEELAHHASYEDVVWLLLAGELPSAPERAAMQQDLAAGTRIPDAVWRVLAALPAGAAPIARLQVLLPLLGLTVPELADESDLPAQQRALRLCGAFAMLAGCSLRGARAGEVPADGAHVSVAELFLRQVRGEAVPAREVRVLEQVLILYADHELNASTFTGRVAASTRAGLISAVLAALCALRGPLHGGVDRFVRSMLAAAEQEGAERVVDRYLKAGAMLPGFGHAVYRGDDPRGMIMRDLARELAPAAGQEPILALTEAIELAAKRRGVPAFNVDLYTVALYRSLRIPDALSTLVFAVGRLAGWCAHILEQYADNRLIRPRAAYTGAAPRLWPDTVADTKKARPDCPDGPS